MPLIGYSRARAGADRGLWTSLRAAAARKPRPPPDERALPRRREGRIVEAAVLPSSRHAPRGDNPRGTPGGVVRPRNPPRPRGVLAGEPASPRRRAAPAPLRAAPPGKGRLGQHCRLWAALTPRPRGSAAGRPSFSPACVRRARQWHPAPPQKVEVFVDNRLQSTAEGKLEVSHGRTRELLPAAASGDTVKLLR